jgi:hypothetical protein
MTERVVQAANLEIHEVPDGYIVYQTDRDRVHYLNKTAAIILEFCDGLRGRKDIVSRVAKVFELGPSAHEEIEAGLDALVKEGLILSPSR